MTPEWLTKVKEGRLGEVDDFARKSAHQALLSLLAI